MSIIGKIEGVFESGARDVAGLAGKVVSGIKDVWSFLVSAANLIDGAWSWMVNGAEWFTSKVEDWAGDVYTAVAHILVHVIPEAIAWAIKQATAWAGRAIRDVENWAKTAVANAIKWVKGELDRIESWAKNAIRNVIKFVTAPINWVIKTGERVAQLVLHPELLLKWILSAAVIPLFRVGLKFSVLVAWAILRAFQTYGGVIASAFEELIEKVV